MMKVVLAYSGGLDTTVIIPWLIENYNCEVIAMLADLGQGEDLEKLGQRAKDCGASKVYIEDLKEEFVRDYIFPVLKAGAVYEGRYLLGTSFARPLIAKRLVEIAKNEDAQAVAHGCTGKGNDQVRFELSVKALAPHLKIIAPWREWDIKSRKEEIEYLKQHGIELPVAPEKRYSTDANLWHVSHEGGILEDPWAEAPEDIFMMTKSPESAPDEPLYIEIGFKEGVPVSLDGKEMDGVALIARLNELAGEHGVGRVDIVENRLVGIKSRGVYECPAGTVLYKAHEDLECLTLDRETMHYKRLIAERYAELVYYGLWFTRLREAFDAFIDKTQENVTGTVRVKLYKGNCMVVGRRSPYSLYREDFATFEQDEVYKQADATGFINLFGLPLYVEALLRETLKEKGLV